MNEGARRDGGRGRAGDRWKGKEWCCWEVVVRGRSSSMGGGRCRLRALVGRGLSRLWAFVMCGWCVVVYGTGVVVCGGS